MLLSLLKRIEKSISLVPFLIAIGFGILAILLVCIPIKFLDHYPMLAIKDSDSIKFIMTFTIGGIFTLTIFTYTMVMNVLNRSISNYSPRLIPLILNERHHQVILGTTSGTLIYCLILSIFISSDAKESFPSVAAPLTIIFGIICILLFIYFVHAVSQSIHVNYIIRKSFLNTKRNIENLLDLKDDLSNDYSQPTDWPEKISFDNCGYLNAIRTKKLLKLSAKYNVEFKLARSMGSFLLEGEPALLVSKSISKRLKQRVKRCLAIDRDEPLDVIEIGFKHLTEVAVKASSPAINDPGTSLIAIDYLTQLFILRFKIPKFCKITPPQGGILHFTLIEIEELEKLVFKEMEKYMNDDPILKLKLSDAKEILSRFGHLQK